ncbi:hypothetical protein SAMN05192544_105414 [Paraburkholderia hospita]|jgi:hypothetical protein|nr:hypothetical protein SAMN05192544_105414 [Paraburkholderia hospita]
MHSLRPFHIRDSRIAHSIEANWKKEVVNVNLLLDASDVLLQTRAFCTG